MRRHHQAIAMGLLIRVSSIDCAPPSMRSSSAHGATRGTLGLWFARKSDAQIFVVSNSYLAPFVLGDAVASTGATLDRESTRSQSLTCGTIFSRTRFARMKLKLAFGYLVFLYTASATPLL